MQATFLQPTSAEHEYCAKWPRGHRWFYLVAGSLVIIDSIVRHSWWNLIPGVCLLAVWPLMMSKWLIPRLVVTPDGIAYHNGGAVLNVPWQDMEYIGRNPRRGWYHDYDGIVLRNARWRHRRWSRWRTGWQRQPIIPLWSRWSGPWWDRELFDDIFSYAPWLAGEGRHDSVSR